MKSLSHLFENNRAWAAHMTGSDPAFFSRLSHQQSPEYLWIGCSDSRVPANEIVGLLPGELFVHRNVANLVHHTDMNCLSVLQYAVQTLRVRHVIVCGHYGCGGVRAALEPHAHGLIDNWLRSIRDVHRGHAADLAGVADRERMLDRLCELNVVQQVLNVAHTTIIREAWEGGQAVAIHGWIYSITNGLLKDLGVSCSSTRELEELERRNPAVSPGP
ncbi:MAG: carbonate dehydratase [Verrucomicrobiota bacterium]